MSQARPWFLYVVHCQDGTLYTGISTDVVRRVKQHNAGQGARYTSTRRPVALRAVWRFPDRTTALKAEIAFKRRGRPQKDRLIEAALDYREGTWDLSAHGKTI